MTEALLMVGGLISFVLLIFLSWKSREKGDNSNVSKITATPSARPMAPPPLPPRNNKTLLTDCPAQQVLDYPKCPIDRCRNEPGKPQVVFWDSEKKCYTCCHGHHFTGRE